MAELATSHSRSSVASALDEHTDLDALLGAILADSASTPQHDAVPGAPNYLEPPTTPAPATRVVATAASSTPATSAVESTTHVTLTMAQARASRVSEPASSKAASRARTSEPITLTLDDLESRIRTVELQPAPAERAEPRLHEIDAFLDSRIGRLNTPGWTTFAPAPSTPDVTPAPASALSAASRRIAAFAAAFGLGVLVVWTVLR